MKEFNKKKNIISLSLVFTILLFLPLINSQLNIKTQSSTSSFNRNVSLTDPRYGYVPYIGAEYNVTINPFNLSADWIFGSLYTDFIDFNTSYAEGHKPGRLHWDDNALEVDGNFSVAVAVGDAELLVDSATNADSCLILQETDNLGMNFCYDGSGTNRWLVRNNSGVEMFEIERVSGDARFYYNVDIDGNLNIDGNITSANTYVKKYPTGNFTGSLYTTGADSTSSDSNSLFQVISDTRGTPQFQVQDGGSGQASLMVRSWIVVNQNNTLLNSSQNNLCADWGFKEIDCNTSTTGADFGVTDDLEVLNLIHAGGGIHTHTNPGGIYLYAGDGDQYSGSNGSYTYATDLFCDTTDSPFLDVGGWLQIIAEGTAREGLAADIDSYANASCIYLKNNPGWNESFSGVTYEVINNPDLVVLDEGFMEYYVGDNPKSQFKVKVKNGTGSTGILFDATAGVDQHIGFELQVDAKGYDGIVGQNIYMKSSIPLVNKEIIALLIEGDASNMNNSHGTFIDLNAIGVPLDLTSTIDGIHFPSGINNILKSGSADVLASAYYNSTNITTNVTDVGNDAQVFVFDNDVLYIGGTTNFTSLSVALTTGSNIDLSFTYSYCNSSYDWQTLAVTDTTSGFRISGTITFLNPTNRGNCSKQTNGVPFSDTTNYTYIALTRTRNTVIIPPTIDRLDISGAAINMFMKEDMLRLNPVDTYPEICVASNLGAIYFDIDNDFMCVCKSTGWVQMDDGSTVCN